MKIALITIHDVSNYGSILQTLATKKILSQYGEVSVINYSNPRLFFDQLNLIRFKPSVLGIRVGIRDILRFKYRIQVIKKFKKIMLNNLNLSKLVTQDDLQNGTMSDFDVYVCGSDQIWNSCIVSKCGELDPIYFLSFASPNARKIAFASSMGAYHFRDSEPEKVKNLLTDFTMISVRESDTQEALSQLLGKEVHHVLDPVFLLSKEEWFEELKMSKNYRTQQEDYILAYKVLKDPLMIKVVDYLRKKMGIKVVTIEQSFKPFINADIFFRDAGPLEFVELFANARFVVTNSFHGTSFSINFKRPFVSICSVGTANRIKSILDLFGLQERFISNEKDILKLNTDFYNNDSYNEYLENKLKHERAKSLEILNLSMS